MYNNKKTQEKNNRKMERLEQIKREVELNEYLTTYEYALEETISNRELLKNVIDDIMKF